MRATIYQESPDRARRSPPPPARGPLAPALSALLALAALGPSSAACNSPAAVPAPALPARPAAPSAPASASAEAAVSDGGRGEEEPALDGKSVHFTRLQPFAPRQLLEYKGGRLTASTAQFGEVAVSEVERSYTGEGDRTAKVRLVDTSINRGAKPPRPGAAFEDEDRVGRPLQTGGAAGYVEFDKESRRAVANLIVADRVLVTVSCENARGPEDVERLAGALDLRRLDALLRAQAAPR